MTRFRVDIDAGSKSDKSDFSTWADGMNHIKVLKDALRKYGPKGINKVRVQYASKASSSVR